MTATLTKLTVKRLYGVAEVAAALGVDRAWVRRHITRGAPQPDFEAAAGRKMMMLWTQASVDRWRAYHASELCLPITEHYASFSDHNAVNRVGRIEVTWKLWWRNTFDGGAMWWYSTPRGWYVSNNDGRTWEDADVMVKPGGYHYFAVNGNVTPQRHVANVLRSAAELRQRLENAS
jgi:hypothetical protein